MKSLLNRTIGFHIDNIQSGLFYNKYLAYCYLLSGKYFLLSRFDISSPSGLRDIKDIALLAFDDFEALSHLFVPRQVSLEITMNCTGL